jgi:hypothetical protein
VDNLRKADALSLRKATLAIRLRNMEAFEQDLGCDDWKPQREVFLKMMESHLLALPDFFIFFSYFPRVFALSVACKEYNLSVRLLGRLNRVIDLVQNDCKPAITASKRSIDEERIIGTWRRHLVRALSEALAAALRPQQVSDQNGISKVLRTLNGLGSRRDILLPTSEAAISWARRFFECDMGNVAFRNRYFEEAFGRIEKKAWPTTDDQREPASTVPPNSPFEEKDLLGNLRSFLRSIKREGLVQAVPMALAYPTRPFRTDELYILVSELLNKDKSKIRRWAKAFRGFSLGRQLPGRRGGDGFIVIPFRKPLFTRRIAVTSWETSEDSWKACVTRQPDPDRTRYQRLGRLMNAILAAKKRPDYVVLHELSLPWNWFLRVASRFQEMGMSLIAGIEYLPVVPSKTVTNEVWASMVSGLRMAIVYRQRKARPALHEELELKSIGGLELADLGEGDRPVLQHGKFQFGILVCSELTNVDYRKGFRGKVDAVFVPEWNKDTETFSSLMEASALDIHAFMIQCNNRIYGDSRIRVPSASLWERDIIRVKGGVEDYFVIGEVDVKSLRQFQSNYRSPTNGRFKPVPDGFKLDSSRRMVP